MLIPFVKNIIWGRFRQSNIRSRSFPSSFLPNTVNSWLAFSKILSSMYPHTLNHSVENAVPDSDIEEHKFCVCLPEIETKWVQTPS